MKKPSPREPRHHTPALITAAVLCALPALAQAQAASAPPPAPAASEPTTTLAPVRVTATTEQERATGPVQGYTARRSATATKTDTPLNEVPQSITVITAEQVRDQNAGTMQDALRYTAGVRHEMYGLDNRGDWFSMRGGSEGSVLLDGLRLPLTGWYGVVRNEPFAFERIEVLRGPASVIAGQNGPGGVVNLVSKRPQADAVREIELQLGNHAHQQFSADIGGSVDADATLMYRVVGLYKDSGTQVDHANERRTYLAPSLTWAPDTATRLTLFAEYQKDDSANLNGFFPIEGTLNPAPNGFIPYDTFIGEPAWDRYGGERLRFGYQLEQAFGDSWKLRHNLRFDQVDGGMRSMYAAWWLGYANADGSANPNGTHLNRIYYATDDSARILNADLLFEGQLRWGNTRHTLLAGLDAMRNTSEQVGYQEGDATPLDVYHPVYGGFPLPDFASMRSSTTASRQRTLGALLQDQIKFDERFVLVAGLRRDRSRLDTDITDITDTTGTTPAPQDDYATTKNLGAVYLAPAGVSPYLSYSESFEPVAPSNGQVFKPKRGKQVEAGVKWAPPQQRFTAAAALYKLKEENRVTDGPTPSAPSGQLGEVTVDGVELEANATLPGWDVIAQYTYMNARETSDTPDRAAYRDKQLSGIPRHSASAWGVLKFDRFGAPGLRAGLGVRYVGDTSDGLDRTTVPSVTLLDAMLAYDLRAWRLALNVSNLADKTYIATCLDRGDCWFGTQRRAVLSLAYRW
ncbi:TonB-dependent siderophore receptor [Sphaerotilaceae bacterium SBD11-9]